MFFKRGEAGREAPNSQRAQLENEEFEKYLETSKRERIEEQKRKALTYLQETGRASNPEEAEQYLGSIGKLKEKLVLFARERMCEKQAMPPSRREYFVNGVVANNAADEEDLNRFNVSNIDRTNPQLWAFDLKLRPRYYDFLPEKQRKAHGSLIEGLNINLTDNSIIRIESGLDQPTAPDLQKYLSAEELEFLKQELVFARSDFERQLRELADDIREHPDRSRNFDGLFESDNAERIDPVRD